MDLSIQEKIELILSFYTWHGYLKETVQDFPEAVKFIEAGCAFLDEESSTYKMNSTGEAFLHNLIKNISEDFISFLKSNGNASPKEDVEMWFANSYEIDTQTAKALMDYICKNLSTYDYNAVWAHSSKYGERYVLQKLT